MKRHLATVIAGIVGLAPGTPHAKPARPSIHREAEQARKACSPWAQHVQAAAKAHGLDGHTLEALVWLESRCRPAARSKRSGARGMGQHTRSGAAAVGRIQRASGVTPWFTYARTLDPIASIHAAATLLVHGLELCGGLAEAVTLYNRGGRCGKPNAFSRAVLRLAAALRWAAGEEPRS